VRIYIDIESLFDWRYGRLCYLDPSIKMQLVERYEEYQKRDHDSFWNMFASIDKGAYKKLKFTKELFKYTQLTKCDKLIVEAILAYTANPATTVDKISVDVDFMGLTLTDEEKEKFAVRISSRFDHSIKINVISRPKLNPKKLNIRYQLAIIYDLNVRLFPYMKKPADAITKCNVYTPFRFKDDMELKAQKFLELHKSMPYKGDQLTVLEEHLFGAAPIHFIEMKYFCLHTPMP